VVEPVKVNTTKRRAIWRVAGPTTDYAPEDGGERSDGGKRFLEDLLRYNSRSADELRLPPTLRCSKLQLGCGVFQPPSPKRLQQHHGELPVKDRSPPCPSGKSLLACAALCCPLRVRSAERVVQLSPDGSNPGGGIEVVIPEGSAQMTGFSAI
jgi:hypothetical protein